MMLPQKAYMEAVVAEDQTLKPKANAKPKAKAKAKANANPKPNANAKTNAINDHMCVKNPVLTFCNA